MQEANCLFFDSRNTPYVKQNVDYSGHGGIDITGGTDSNISHAGRYVNVLTPFEGTVVGIKNNGTQYGSIPVHKSFGNAVIISFPNKSSVNDIFKNQKVVLAHLKSITSGLAVGSNVNAGDIIGVQGQTGNTQGTDNGKSTHLHIGYINSSGNQTKPPYSLYTMIGFNQPINKEQFYKNIYIPGDSGPSQAELEAFERDYLTPVKNSVKEAENKINAATKNLGTLSNRADDEDQAILQDIRDAFAATKNEITTYATQIFGV